MKDLNALLNSRWVDVRVEALPAGDAGVFRALAIMRELCRKYYRNPAIQAIARRFRGRTQRETIARVFAHVLATMRYAPDPPNTELIVSPKHTILGPWDVGDCDDLTLKLGTLLAALGFPVSWKVIAWRKPDYTHVYALVFSGRRWLPLDPTAGKTGLFREMHPVLVRRHATTRVV